MTEHATPTTARGTGRGKLILFGEHAVVYGQPALVAALDRRVVVSARASQRPGLHIRVDSPGDRADSGAVDLAAPSVEADRLHRAFGRLLRKLRPLPVGIVVEITSQLPAGAGLGSSAALSVAAVRALAGLAERDLDDEATVEIAGRVDTVFHGGRASGIDVAASVYGGVLCFRRQTGPERLELAPKVRVHLVVAHVEAAASTAQMVERVAERLRTAPRETREKLRAIGLIADQARGALRAGEHDEIGRLMNENHDALRGLGVSTPTLDRFCRVALDAGALGAKLTGSGGGGCVMAVGGDCESAIDDALVEAGAMWVFRAQLEG